MTKSYVVYGVKSDDISSVIDLLDDVLDMKCLRSTKGNGCSFSDAGAERGANAYVHYNVEESEGDTYMNAPDFPEYPVLVTVHGYEKHQGLLNAIETAPGLNAKFLMREEIPNFDDLESS